MRPFGSDEGRIALRDKAQALAAFLVIFTILFFSLTLAFHASIQGRAQRERNSVLVELSVLRARLEREISARVSLERGLVSFMTLHLASESESFSAYAADLLDGDPVIRSVAVLKGTTIVQVYPFEANKAALGRDLAQVPEQRDMVLYARDSGRTVIAGPVNLVQGGRGIISRMPIFRGGPAPEERVYWGQASVVLDVDRLLEVAGLFSNASLSLALRPNQDPASGVFAGEPRVLEQSPVEMGILLQEAPWILAAVPTGGWTDLFPQYLLGVVVSALFSGAIALLVALIVHARSALRDMAHHDVLTGLPNRKLYWDRFNLAASFADRHGHKVAIFMIDLDGFKSVNDEFGHAAGDALLKEVSARLRASVRAGDTVARLGGDEFSLIAVVEPDASSLPAILQRLEACFAEPFPMGPETLKVDPSLGCAIWPDEGETIDLVLAKADARMYEAKRVKRRFVPAPDRR